jgi:hypothetical protein
MRSQNRGGFAKSCAGSDAAKTIRKMAGAYLHFARNDHNLYQVFRSFGDYPLVPSTFKVYAAEARMRVRPAPVIENQGKGLLYWDSRFSSRCT